LLAHIDAQHLPDDRLQEPRTTPGDVTQQQKNTALNASRGKQDQGRLPGVFRAAAA
jgi:hypothetical protein